MPKANRKSGVIEALLDEYRVVLADLKRHLRGVSPRDLARIADPDTSNPDCVSIQSVLTHVVYCGYNYLMMMDRHRGGATRPRPKRVVHADVAEYLVALDRLMAETETFFADVSPGEMARHAPEKKLRTGWGQICDYEQLMEHAIVHVSRHRRQIQRFKKLLARPD